MSQQPSGWYTDPTTKYSYRFWNGSQWTNQVSTGGNTGTVDGFRGDLSGGAIRPRQIELELRFRI